MIKKRLLPARQGNERANIPGHLPSLIEVMDNDFQIPMSLLYSPYLNGPADVECRKGISRSNPSPNFCLDLA
jgi:hypothetical protein